MIYRIENNRLFINEKGIALHTKNSHYLRTIVSKVLRIFCCCFRNSFQSFKDDKASFNKRYFGFETFKVTLENKEIYLKKEDYLNWRQNNYYRAFKCNSFSGDLLNLVQEVKKHTEKREQKQINPEDQQKEMPDLQIKEKPKAVPQNLLGFFKKGSFDDLFELQSLLTNCDNEFFKNAVRDFAGDRKLSAQPTYETIKWLKAVYPHLNTIKKLILINTIAFPEWLVYAFPKDLEIEELVSEKILIDPKTFQDFFVQLDQLLIRKDFHLKELAKKIIKKFVAKNDLSVVGKENPFRLNLQSESLPPPEYSMIDLLLEELSFDQAFTALTFVFQSHPFNTAFALRIWMKMSEALSKKNQGRMYSDDSIQFSLQFLEALKLANQSKVFLENFGDYNAQLFRVYDLLIPFFNGCIIAALKSRPKASALKILDHLLLGDGITVMMSQKPLKNSPNIVLEKYLSDQDKEIFLDWSRSQKDGRMQGIAFLNYPLEKKPKIIDIEQKQELHPAVQQEIDHIGLVNFFVTQLEISDASWQKVLEYVKPDVYKQAIIQFTKDKPEQTYSQVQFRTWIKKLYLNSDEDQKNIFVDTLPYPQWIAFCFPQNLKLLKQVSDKLFSHFEALQNFFKLEGKDVNWKPSEEEIDPLLKCLFEKLRADPKGHLEPEKNLFNLDYENAKANTKILKTIVNSTKDWVDHFLCITNCIKHEKFSTKFGLDILKIIYYAYLEIEYQIDETDVLFDYKVPPLSLKFTWEWLSTLERSGKINQFLKDLWEKREEWYKNRTITTKYLLNSTLIYLLRYLPREEQNPLLNWLFESSSEMFVNYICPLEENPNSMLENQLSSEEKRCFLEWCQTHELMKHAYFERMD